MADRSMSVLLTSTGGREGMAESRKARMGSIFNVFLQTSFMDDPRP